MQKRPLQDIVVKGKGGAPARENPVPIQRGPAPTTLPPSPRRVRPEAPPPPPRRERMAEFSPPPRIPMRPRRRGGFPWLWAAGIASVCILVLAFGLSVVFSGATVTAHPRAQKAFVEGTFVASREAAPGQLSYELLSLEQTLTEEIEATGQEEVAERASGRITIYNTNDELPQRLIKNTRFESAEGKIFRIQESVNVPGATKSATGETRPGVIEVTVFADEPGEAYNVPSGRFTIPGFQGTPRFEAFYAESSAPMAGGFVGVKKTVDEEEAAAVRLALNQKLQAALLEEAFSEGKKPEEYYLYKDAVFFRFEELPQTATEGERVAIAQRGEIFAVLLKKDELARFIGTQAVAGYDNEQVELLNPDELTVKASELPPETSPQRPWEGGSVSLAISGTAHIVWTYDQEQLAQDLAGRSTDALETILSGYKGIERATVVHRPFWKRTFPERPEDIEVVEALD